MIHPTFATIFAAAIPLHLQMEDWGRVLLVSIPLLAVLFAGMAVIHHARRKTQERPPSKADLLAQFREAHQAGEIDDAEFRRVTELLLGSKTPRPAAHVRKSRVADAEGTKAPAEEESPRPDEGPTSGTS